MSDEVAVRLTEDGPQRVRGNSSSWERGETRLVSAEHAEALVDVHGDGVEIVDDTPEAGDEPPDENEGGTAGAVDYDELTKSELYDLATERDIDGRSSMSKDELKDALTED